VTSAIAPDVIEGRLLEEEHRRLREGLVRLQESIRVLHDLPRPDAVDRVTRTLSWLRRDVLPHAAWEEAWLYPHVDTLAGTPWATRALRFEHDQVRDMATALEREFLAAEERWSPAQTSRLAVAMARLETLIAAHLAQELWFVNPLLEHLPQSREGDA
jgi:hemerythrin-like domain-containing protein